MKSLEIKISEDSLKKLINGEEVSLGDLGLHGEVRLSVEKRPLSIEVPVHFHKNGDCDYRKIYIVNEDLKNEENAEVGDYKLCQDGLYVYVNKMWIKVL